MAVQVMQPQKRRLDMGTLGTLVGAGVGAAVAPAGGMQAGASLGASLGGAAGGLLNQASASPNQEGGAMQRRMQQSVPQQTVSSQAPDIQALEQARMELANQPPEVRQQYEPPIRAALLKARRGIA